MRSIGSLRAGVLVTAAVIGVSPSAAEVVLTFGVEQRLEAGRNVDLTVPEEGRSIASVTRLAFGAVSRTPLDVLEFSAAGALLVENAGDGTEAGFDRPEMGLRYTREVPNALFTIGAQYQRDDIDAFDEDLAEADLGVTRADTRADVRLETGRTAPLGLAFSAEYLKTEYEDTTDPELVDTETARVGAAATLRFTEVLEGRVGLAFERETRADTPGVSFETGIASVGLTYLLANGSASADLSRSSDDEEGDRTTLVLGRTLVLPAATVTAQIGATNGEIGGTDVIGSLAWEQTLPSGSLDLLVERSVSFDEGAIESVTETRASITWGHDINAVSSLGLSLSHEIADAPSERSTLSQFAATYRYALTEDWGLDSGVRYRVRHNAEGRSESPDVFVALSRSFEFRP
jgi:hypothetical protein